jgi:hypothetical protein
VSCRLCKGVCLVWVMLVGRTSYPSVRVSVSASAGFTHVWVRVLSDSDFYFLMNLLALCICNLLSYLSSYLSACLMTTNDEKSCVSSVVYLWSCCCFGVIRGIPIPIPHEACISSLP